MGESDLQVVSVEDSGRGDISGFIPVFGQGIELLPKLRQEHRPGDVVFSVKRIWKICSQERVSVVETNPVFLSRWVQV